MIEEALEKIIAMVQEKEFNQNQQDKKTPDEKKQERQILIKEILEKRERG